MSMAGATDEREAVQQALRSGDFDATRFGSPEHGRVVELLMCEHLDLSWCDERVADARDSEGTPIQTKACQEWHENGASGRARGRWDAWEETLLHLIADGGMYLLVVYDGDREPSEVGPDDLGDYVLAWRFVEAAAFGELIDPSAWHDHNRPSKGRRARVNWSRVFDPEVVE